MVGSTDEYDNNNNKKTAIRTIWNHFPIIRYSHGQTCFEFRLGHINKSYCLSSESFEASFATPRSPHDLALWIGRYNKPCFLIITNFAHNLSII